MRACTRCGVVKALDAFPPVRRGEPKLQTWCRECFAAYGKVYYRANREAQKARLLRNVQATREQNRLRTVEYLLRHPCVDCGNADIVVLQFDHMRDKTADIARLVASGRTWAAIVREIEKCEVRCSNCHRRRDGPTKNPLDGTGARSREEAAHGATPDRGCSFAALSCLPRPQIARLVSLPVTSQEDPTAHLPGVPARGHARLVRTQ